MAQCEILQSFKGSQDGRFTESFEAGTTRDMSEYLMANAPKGSFRLAGTLSVPENKATITSQSRGNRK
jgi:hypothetical protein